MLGFGVFQVDDQRVCEKVVGEAIDSGYRLLDTAMTYNNEEALGRAVKIQELTERISLSLQRYGFPILATTGLWRLLTSHFII